MLKIVSEEHILNALKVLNGIPEFSTTFFHHELEKRLTDAPVILVAYINNKPVGCKIGYNRYKTKVFYSWLGGVLPTYRKQNIAQKLLLEMEKQALQKGFTRLSFKTLNKHRNMLLFAIKNNFEIVGVEKSSVFNSLKIILEKSLI